MIITEHQLNPKKSKEINALEKYPNFEIRHIVGPPKVWFRIYDSSELLLLAKFDSTENYAVLTNNSGLVELAQNYFNSSWFSAFNPQDQEFKRDRRQFDYLFSNMINGFSYNKMIFDDDNKPADFIIIESNKAFEELTGISRTNLGKRATKIWPDTGKPLKELLTVFGQVVSTGTSVALSNFSLALGKWFSILAYSPEKGYFATIMEDITERKKTQEMLQESEEKFRNLAEQSPSMIFINKQGKIVYANRRSEETLGYTKEEFYSPDFDFLTLVSSEFKEKLAFSFKKHMLDEEVPPFEYALVTKEGKKIEVILTSKLIKYEKENAILGIVTDISERKRTQESLKENEEKYHHLAKNAPAVLYEMDCKSLRFKSVNEYMSELSGYSKKELLAMSPFDLLDAESKVLFQEIIRKSVNKEKIDQTVEFGGVTKAGSKLWVEANAKLIYKNDELDTAFVVAHDITKRKEAEEALKKSEEQYHALFANLIDGFAFCKMIFDENNKPIDFVYLEVNDAFERIIGLKKKAVVGKRVTEAIPGIEKANPELFEIYGRVAQTRVAEKFEVFFKPLNKRLAISVYSPEKGYFAAIFEDITEHRNARRNPAY